MATLNPAIIGTLTNGRCPKPSGLVGWYRGENNTNDQTGNITAGTWVGTPTYTTGKVGNAFSFSGTAGSSMVNLGNPASFNTQVFSCEFWMQRASASNIGKGASGGYCSFVGHGAGGWVLFGKNNGSFQLSHGWGVSDWFSAGTYLTGTGWHHVAFTYNNGSPLIYVDGKVIPETPTITGTFTYAYKWSIGGVYYNTGGSIDPNSGFWGQLDELSFYNRVLTPNEIWGIYNSPNGKSLN